MRLDTFKHEFRQRYGFRFANCILFKTGELYNLETKQSKKFRNLDDALDYEIDGKTIRQRIDELTMDDLKLTLNGGRGSNYETHSFRFMDGSSGGSDQSVKDFNSRANTQVKQKSLNAALDVFRQMHAKDKLQEHAFAVDENGYVHKYVHGESSSVVIEGGKGEMIFHNHPSGGNFSKQDMLSTALTAEKGIVASGIYGDYIFVKTDKFKAANFVKAVNEAESKGRSYDDAIGKWLKAHQKEYGYTYQFRKAKGEGKSG